MICKAVLNLRKIKTKFGCIEVLKHNLRKKSDLESFINVSKSHLNYYNGATDENFLLIFDQITYNLPRKIQKNASHLVEFAISFSPEYSEGWENDPELQKKIRNYFDKAAEFLQKWYGIKYICRMDHWDEKTPHSHILFVPLYRGKKDEFRFSSSEFLGKRKDFFALHDRFHSHVGKPFDLARGIRNSRTPHMDLNQYEEWEKSQRQYIENLKTELIQEKKELNEEKDKIKRENEFLENQKKNLFERMGDFFKKYDQITKKANEFEKFEKNMNESTPKIELPPALLTEIQRRQWRDQIQNTVKDAFSNMSKGVQSIKIKYLDIINKYNDLLKLCKSLYTRAIKAENDLQNKPIKEIEAEREAKLKEKQEREQQERYKYNSTSKPSL